MLWLYPFSRCKILSGSSLACRNQCQYSPKFSIISIEILFGPIAFDGRCNFYDGQFFGLERGRKFYQSLRTLDCVCSDDPYRFSAYPYLPTCWNRNLAGLSRFSFRISFRSSARLASAGKMLPHSYSRYTMRDSCLEDFAELTSSLSTFEGIGRSLKRRLINSLKSCQSAFFWFMFMRLSKIIKLLGVFNATIMGKWSNSRDTTARQVAQLNRSWQDIDISSKLVIYP